jgi:hypothetical protein
VSVAETQLDTPIIDDIAGIHYVNFFNGRQLSAEDLQDERDATRRHQQQLGRGAGAGVIDGLLVRADAAGATVLHVSKGLAVNRHGQILSLPQDVDIALRITSQPIAPDQTDDAGLFGDCRPPTPQVITTTTGLYVLLLEPASALRERMPKVGLTDQGVAARCDFAWSVEGVQFSVKPIDPRAMTSVGGQTIETIAALTRASDTRSLSRLRDEVAHAFLGTEAVAAHDADLLLRQRGESPMTSYGEMDRLWQSDPQLSCVVPVAIFQWTDAGLQIVDMWAVRRRLTPASLSRTWPVPLSARRVAEGEAAFFHFQDQLEWLFTSLERPRAFEARDYFRYLPPAGVLPLDSGAGLIDPGTLTFFNGQTVRRPAFIAAAAVEPLLRESLAYAPIDLAERDARGRPRPALVWLYQVRENEPANNPAKAQRYLVFATGHMPYAGHARLDVSWCDFSNYSSLRLGAAGA